MRNQVSAFWLVSILLIGAALASLDVHAQEKAPQGTVPVHMVVTVEPLSDDDSATTTLSREDVQVRQGRDRLEVSEWIPSRGEQAALQLFILIDDTSDTRLGSHLDELRTFITAQPATTSIGIGYMRNTAVNIVQNFTTDHAQAAKAVRLPLGSLGASDSPYLSLISLLKGWPESKLRREVLMVTDGIDRLRGYDANAQGSSFRASSGPPGRGGAAPNRVTMPTGPATMPYISVDVDTASRAAQRSGVIVHSIYTPGVGHAGRNVLASSNGQNGLSKLADETGGESFFLGVQNPVSFQPFLERLQKIVDNQYFLVFRAIPGKRADLQRIKISTEVPKVEIVSADSVWVPSDSGSGR